MLLTRAILLGLMFPATSSAQGERFTFRSLPPSGTAVRIALTQEMRFDIAGPALPSPMALEGSSRMIFTQRTDQPDSIGIRTARLVFDSVRMNLAINGVSIAPPMEELVGKTLTIKYDSAGSVIDLTVPGELDRFASQLRALLSAAMSALPAASLAPGDSATTSQKVPIPFEMGMAPGEGPALEITSRFLLRRVGEEEGEMIAVLDQVNQGSMVRPVTLPGVGTAQVNLKMEGTGTIEVYTRTGVVRSATNDARMNMAMDLGGGGTMTMVGTVWTLTQGSVVR